MKGLIIRDPWATKILDGEKTWEIRGSYTHIRERIVIVKSGQGAGFGEVNLIDCIPVTQSDLKSGFAFHRIPDNYPIQYKRPHAWVMELAAWYPEPIRYHHPKGAIIWIDFGNRRVG